MSEEVTASNHLHLIHPENISFRRKKEQFLTLRTTTVITSQSRIEESEDDEDEYSFVSISPLIIDNNDIVTVVIKVKDNKNTTTVTWNKDDWIGAYVPDNANILSITPVKFGYCSQDSNYLRNGVAMLHFNFTNHRSMIRFHMFKGGLRKPVWVASSKEVVRFRNINQPLRNRIIPTGDPDVYQLLWSSYNSTNPVLMWDLQSQNVNNNEVLNTHTLLRQNNDKTISYIRNNYSNVIQAISTRKIEKSSLCSEGTSVATTKGWIDLGEIHTANISGEVGILALQDKGFRTLHYIFGDAATQDFSEEFTLTIPPKTGQISLDRPTQVILLADLGVGSSDSSYDTKVWSEVCPPALNTSQSIGHKILSGTIDAIFHSGDISYANGYLSNWDYFMNMIAPIAGRAIYLTTLGNHESVWPQSPTIYHSLDSGGECGVLSTAMLPLPYPATANQPWWSYDIGMGTEHDYTVGSAQYMWLERDLQMVNRSLTPWIVFSGHRPMYVDSGACCGWGIPDDVCDNKCLDYTDVGAMRLLQQHVEPLLYKYRVNLAFAGHFHNVERQSAVYKNKVIQQSVQTIDEDGNIVHMQKDPSATVWMVIGSAGNGPSYSNKKYTWSEASWDNLYGYSIITAINATYLKWVFINSATDEIVDRLVITQDFEAWELSEGVTTDDNTISEGGEDQSYFSLTAQIIVLLLGSIALFSTIIVAYVYNTYYKKLSVSLIQDHHNGLLQGDSSGRRLGTSQSAMQQSLSTVQKTLTSQSQSTHGLLSGSNNTQSQLSLSSSHNNEVDNPIILSSEVLPDHSVV